MKPSIGRIVYYVLTEQDAKQINNKRVQGMESKVLAAGHTWDGTQVHIGNSVFVGEIVPMVILKVWPNEFGPNYDGVNGQVLLDGNDSYWVTSVKEGVENGMWRWPERVEG